MREVNVTFKQQLVIRVLCTICRMLLSSYDTASKPLVELLEKFPEDIKAAIEKDKQS